MTRQPLGIHGPTHDPLIGSDPIPGVGPSPSMVWGALFNDGNIIAGTGFTASWDGIVAGNNQYTITFGTAFTNPPIVLLSANNNNPATATDGEYTVSLLGRLVGSITVVTLTLGSVAADGGFDFLCIEPGV